MSSNKKLPPSPPKPNSSNPPNSSSKETTVPKPSNQPFSPVRSEVVNQLLQLAQAREERAALKDKDLH
jgi:hypothetical protein